MTSKGVHNVSYETFHVQHEINKKIGSIGEEIACRYLIERGHSILSRNTKLGRLEFDIESTFHGKRIIHEVKTVAREKVMPEYISREMFLGASRYSHDKSNNMRTGQNLRASESLKLLCVTLSLQDCKAYVDEIEVF